MANCKKCSMPTDEKTKCACQPDLCFHCCDCDEACSCGCKKKEKEG